MNIGGSFASYGGQNQLSGTTMDSAGCSISTCIGCKASESTKSFDSWLVPQGPSFRLGTT